MSDDAKTEIAAAVRGAGRVFQVIEGGSRREPPSGDAAPPDECPITALGHVAGTCYFLDAGGQQRELTARQLGSRHDLLMLFHGNDSWLRQKFPKKLKIKAQVDGQEAEQEITVDFLINKASASLQAQCAAAGLYGDHIVLRRPGVWPSAEGLPVVHCGDQVLFDGKMHRAGAKLLGQVWAAAPPAPRPGTPCEAAVARDLQESLRSLWNFRQPGGEIAVLGLIGTAHFGAAVNWRTSGFLIGGAGSGKSSLLKVMRACCPQHFYSNDTSKAGLEQDVAGRAMPSFLDEAEKTSGDGRGPRELLDLVLTASSGEGTRGHRGGLDGRARRIEIVGSFVMAATSPPPMSPTHLGRFTIVELDRPDDGADHEAQHGELAAKMREWAPRLWGRSISSYERHAASMKQFRAALQRAGCAPREMDQIGALLSGWWILVAEGAPSDRDADEGVAALQVFVRTRDEVQQDDGPRRMLQLLLSHLAQLDRSTDREAIGSLINLALRPYTDNDGRMAPDHAARLLGNYGLRPIRADDCHKDKRGRLAPRAADGAGIWFALRSQEIEKVFRDTPFAEGRWLYELRRLESARSPRMVVRIGATLPCRALWVSAEELGFECDETRPP